MDKIKVFFKEALPKYFDIATKVIKGFFKDNYDSIVKPVVVLLAICIIIPLALAATNMITHERIKGLEQKQRDEAMGVLYTDATFRESEGKDYFVAQKGEETLGFIFTEYAKGYGGDVSVMTAINLDGTIKAIKILDVSNETPGLGQNASKEEWYSQFEGLKGIVSINKLGADSSKGEISPVTGATITSNAVKDAVNKAIEKYTEITQKGEQNSEE